MLLLFLQDGRLRSGDHILRIADTDLLGMGSEQVAQVLRQCGNRVRLVVTRGPADEGSSCSAVMPVLLPTVSEQQVEHQSFFFFGLSLLWVELTCWIIFIFRATRKRRRTPLM